MKNVSQLPFHSLPSRSTTPFKSVVKKEIQETTPAKQGPGLPEPSESLTLQHRSLEKDPVVTQEKAVPEANLGHPTPSETKLDTTRGTATQELLTGDSSLGTLTLLESPAFGEMQSSTGPSLVELFGLQDKPPAERRMESQEKTYLRTYPYDEGPKAETIRAELKDRYTDPKNSTLAFSRELSEFAEQRGVVSKVPPEFDKPLTEVGVDALKKALDPTLGALFGNKDANHNPEKLATATSQSHRFLDLVAEAAPDISAADAFKLASDNTVLVAYQDRVASEVFMGDHGVRHLLGHNIRVCEELADKVVAQGGEVSAKDRLIMHQTMVMHDLGYAMNSVRNGIQADGIVGQEHGHNVLAARVLREQSSDPAHPLNKLFEKTDLEHIHSCILHHDKDAQGKPGIELRMGSQLSEEDRRVNLETIVRTADNTHAFDDKLPELLLQEPQALKSLRMIQTAVEIGDTLLFEDLKGDLKQTVESRDDLAPDDRRALSSSVDTIDEVAHRFNTRRIAGRQPSYEVSQDGIITVGVKESPIHRQVAGLFGQPAYKQLEKFVEENSGQEVKLNGRSERVEGGPLVVDVQLGTSPEVEQSAFESQVTDSLKGDPAFSKFALLDAQLSKQQQLLGDSDPASAALKDKRRQLLQEYRQSQKV